MKQEKVNIQEGYDIGIGVAMASGSPMALGAIGEVTAPEVGGGGSGTFTFRRIDSNETLATELGISAEVSGGIGLFAGSASLDFTKRCRIQTSSLAVMVSTEEQFAFRQMDSPALSPAASQLVATGNTSRFAEQFGDYFVRGIASGGRFIGVVRINTRSVQAKTDLDSALHVRYGLNLDAEAKVHISNALAAAEATIDVFVHHEGGSFTTEPTSSDPTEALRQLFEAMDQWSATVRAESAPYHVTLAPYAIALGPNPPNAAELEHQRDVLIRCARLRLSTMDKQNLVDYILDPRHSAEFAVEEMNGLDLPALQAAFGADLEVIADAASFAIDNPKEARAPEDFMRQIKGVADFTLTALPANLPSHVGVVTTAPKVQVQVPDVLTGVKRVPGMAHVFIRRAGLRFEDLGPLTIMDGPKVLKGEVVSQDPAAGVIVDADSVVRLGIGNYADRPLHLGKHV
jgi:hypothetical protein